MGSQLEFFFLVIFCLLSFPAPGASLTVTSPESMKGNHKTAMAKFGGIVPGGSMDGTVVYPNGNQKGCDDFDRFGISFHGKNWAVPAFLLVDRGDCYFALKVWNAQKMGASAVLIADNAEKPLMAMDPPTEESAKYVHNITIPSVMISKSFGDQVKKSLSSGEMVNMKLDMTDGEENEISGIIDLSVSCPCPRGCGCCC